MPSANDYLPILANSFLHEHYGFPMVIPLTPIPDTLIDASDGISTHILDGGTKTSFFADKLAGHERLDEVDAEIREAIFAAVNADKPLIEVLRTINEDLDSLSRRLWAVFDIIDDLNEEEF